MADKIDPQLKHFIAATEEKLRFQQVILSLTDQCWDKCMTGTPGQKLDRKTEQCFVNCVQRFVETNHYVANRFAKQSTQLAASSSAETTEGFKWQ